MITKMEKMVKEDMAAYILEELSKHGCIKEEKRTTAMNVITKALLDIRRCRRKGDETKMPDSSEHCQAKKQIDQFNLTMKPKGLQGVKRNVQKM